MALTSRWHCSAPCAEAARPLDFLLLQLAQLPASLGIDLLRGAVMDRLHVRLSEVVEQDGIIKKASCAPHLPYVSCLPEKLVCGGSGVSCGVGLAMWGRCGMPPVTRGAKRDA